MEAADEWIARQKLAHRANGELRKMGLPVYHFKAGFVEQGRELEASGASASM